MSAAQGEERRAEIIIVRRGGGDEDEGHHGGVWKIAFADFMTAMMCFFLVMWLINAANEQTRAALASYFNPIKLIDRNTSSRGVQDIGQGPQSAAEPQEPDPSAEPTPAAMPSPPEAGRDKPASREEAGRHSDDNFFSDPYAVLAEIAADIDRRQNVSDKGEGGVQNAGPSSGASGGEAYRDPFAPDFWSQQVAEPQVGVQGDPDEERGQPGGKGGPPADTPDGPAQAEARPAQQQETRLQAPSPAPVPPVEPLAEEERQAEAAREQTADAVRREIRAALQREGIATTVTVTAGEDGVLISVTDDMRYGMFPVGSAVPARQLVLAMEKIGKTLAGHPGTVRVHGHTDARPFSNGDYDNWRLSTARAHAARYMLVRGGLAEERISEVAGFADRRLKVPDNPLADANRRIDILLEVPR